MISNLIEATGKLGVTLELLVAKNNPAVDPNCKQLIELLDQSAGNYRWTSPPSVEWKTLNVARINHGYSYETLLLCLVHEDLVSHDHSDLSLRERLTRGVSVLKQILYEVNWSYFSLRLTDDQINSFKAVEAENLDIFKSASENTFDQAELSVSDTLFKGMSKFLHGFKQALLKEELNENLRQAGAS